MPFYSRYRRLRAIRYRRRYTRFRRYRRRRSYGGSTSSRFRVRVPVQRLVNAYFRANDNQSTVITISPFVSNKVESDVEVVGVASACDSALYQTYCGLYDQVKCDGMNVRMSLVSPLGTSASFTAMSFISAFDRCGSYNNVVTHNTNVGIPTVEQMKNFSSANTRIAIQNSIAKLGRSCYPQDLQERTTFHDCAIGNLLDDIGSIQAFGDLDYLSNKNKVNYFAPLFMLGLECPVAPTSLTVVQVQLNVTYYFTFRNPKYGVQKVTTFSDTPVRSVADDLSAEDEAADVPQALVDMAARAADVTGRMVRARPISEQPPSKRQEREEQLDLADRIDKAADKWYSNWQRERAAVYKKYNTTDSEYVPPHERDRLNYMEERAKQRYLTAEGIRERVARDHSSLYDPPEVPAAKAAAADLDNEPTLDRTDTLPL
nr:MAG: capsid protein [ssDNA virus sp.]